VKEPIKWFEEAIYSNKYNGKVIIQIKDCILEDRFDIDKFVNWVLNEIENNEE